MAAPAASQTSENETNRLPADRCDRYLHDNVQQRRPRPSHPQLKELRHRNEMMTATRRVARPTATAW
jgi:hypothetical protein